ncbi:MAG: protein kinase [Anaerolineaceae bacterium]
MTTLGKYELHEELGKGGFGTVYRATDTSLDREVALKVLHPQLMVDPNFITRFRKEARILASLDNHHIVTIYELDEVEGRIFISMRFLTGGSLKTLIQQKGALPFKQAVTILRQVIGGLSDAHSKGLVHRDLKPENILFDAHKEAVITDFGLVRDSRDSSFSIGPSGGILGTPSYIAPEIWNAAPASQVSDIYALGCMFYEMLTGRVLFDGKTPWGIMKKHSDVLVLPDEWPEGTPSGTITFMRKALEKDPSSRYQSVVVLEEDLLKLDREKGPIIDPPPPPSPGLIERILNFIRSLFQGFAQNKHEERTAGEKVRGSKGKIWVPVLAVAAVAVVSAYFLVESSFRGFYFSANMDGQRDIYFLNSTHATQKVTSSKDNSEAWDPILAPDGSIFFTCDRFENKSEICVMDPAKGLVYRSTNTPGGSESWDPAPAEGGNVYFTSNRFGVNEILLLNDKAETQKVIHSSGNTESWDAAPTKDGKLYFTSNRSESKAEIYILENGEIKRVTTTPGKYQSWDPTIGLDGRLYFSSDREKGQTDIYVIESDGQVRKVTSSPAITSSWNPVPGRNGNLYFTSNRFGKTEILLMNSRGQIQEVVSIPGNSEGVAPDAENGKN